MTLQPRIYIAGHWGMVGSAIVRRPDGLKRTLLDSSRLNGLGWQAQVKLPAGLALASANFLR
jgi:nucleoside-diphosphate-sugar epimerase